MSKLIEKLNKQGLAVADFLATVTDMKAEMQTMRTLLERQWKADSTLYTLPHDCEKHEHEYWLKEHYEVHKVIGEFLGHNVEVRGGGDEK